MRFTFKVIKGYSPDHILAAPRENLYWKDHIDIEYVSATSFEHVVKGRSEYTIARVDTYLPDEVFANSRVILIVDREAPKDTDKEAFSSYWTNILRAEALAADYLTTKYLLGKATHLLLEKRISDLTGVVASEPLYDWTEGEYRFVYLSHNEDPIFQSFVKDAETNQQKQTWLCEEEFVDLVDEATDGDTEVPLDFTPVFVAPKPHSMLYLSNLAIQCGLLIHSTNFPASVNLDPRTNSLSLGRLTQFVDQEMLGSSGFKVQLDNFMHDLDGLIQSLDVNKYVMPIGDTLFDRLFGEINKSMYGEH